MALDEWLAIDGVSRDEVSEEHRDVEGIAIRRDALVLCEKRHVTVVPWTSVLSVVRVEDRVYALCPRRPPAPPWIELDASHAGALGESLDSLTKNLEARSARRGYREAGPTRSLLSPKELFDRLIAKDPVPGTVEVPVGYGPGGRTRLGTRIGQTIAGLGMGAFGGAYAGAILQAIFVTHPAIAFFAGVATSSAAGGAGMLYLVRDKKGQGRVLALAPDGVVIGLPRGVRAYGWKAIGGFRGEERVLSDGSGRSFPHLVVTAHDGREIGAVHEAWFDRPLALIVAVAEAYRSRFSKQ
jgi:hypothetical protein